ncbi:hypothetical protein VTN77DRAFT_6631 [Rasamsonia byssochlamydoides]|uniref:uncharacterized protein n=1 Tax=Rasamsonia byssochlamydoides TaxID=89139 RepID=UPI0037444656
MAPIRVGLIGLSGAAPENYEGTSWAANAHLPFLQASPHFEIVALLNSSVESAQAAIRKYGLPSETKAYGDPNDLAADSTVDLVVASVRVDRHFLVVRPSIIAGKTVFVEWPLERNLQVAKEMAALAAKHKAKTIVGIQGAFSPLVRKMKEIVENGVLGQVLSSTLLGALTNAGATESKNVRYLLDREVGGNVMSIHAGHTIEFFTAVLGEFKTFDSACTITLPTKDIVDRSAGNKVIVKAARNTVPDQVRFWGTVEPSNAAVTVLLHAGPGIPGLPTCEWRIQGTKGWLRLTSAGLTLNFGNPVFKLEHFDTERNTVEELVPDTDEWDSLPLPARNIARLYEAYRKDEWYPDFEWGVKRHELIEQMWKRFDETYGKD